MKKAEIPRKKPVLSKLHYVWTVGTQIASFVIAVALLGLSVCGGVWIHGTFRKLHLITKNSFSLCRAVGRNARKCES